MPNVMMANASSDSARVGAPVLGRLVRPDVGVPAVPVGVPAVGVVDVGAGVVGPGAAVITYVSEAVHMTVAPPPFPEPLHWSTVTRSTAVSVEVVTVHRTRIVAPPPLPEPLHWVTVAPVVLPRSRGAGQQPGGRVPPGATASW